MQHPSASTPLFLEDTLLSWPKAPFSLEAVIREVEQWRRNKANHSQPIPDALWHKIFTLAQTFAPSKIRTLFNLTSTQYQKKFQELYPDRTAADERKPHAVPPPLELCEVKTTKPAPAYQPLKIPATNTLVVEFCRADGQIMRIHTTTESFEALIKLFFAGA